MTRFSRLLKSTSASLNEMPTALKPWSADVSPPEDYDIFHGKKKSALAAPCLRESAKHMNMPVDGQLSAGIRLLMTNTLIITQLSASDHLRVTKGGDVLSGCEVCRDDRPDEC
ncbi:hypothetical protein IF1G_11324 [Cordyceps javanica]|uniref:Uncharacterized protein n=1 Tax=Cordyceps javanica TaxID=43265 RepID=A0A545UKM5_9HYPO|nr:hypothetical protein IF1G_11324 [Cordyceps javanica]